MGIKNGIVKIYSGSPVKVLLGTYENTNKTIKTIKLDDFIFNGKIDLIKIDVQGWELKVLKSCTKLLNTIIPFESPIDHELNKQIKIHNINVYWSGESLVSQGSSIYGSSYIYY